MQVRSNVVTQQCEETGDREGLVAVADHGVVDCVVVEVEPEERGGRVDGDHEEDADDVALLVGFGVVHRMHEDEVEGESDGECGAGAGDDEAEVVEVPGAGNGDFGDWRWRISISVYNKEGRSYSSSSPASCYTSC
jgi:hypothetical protein